MKIQFDKYLIENKVKNPSNIFTIDQKIHFYPKMIESLYEFLLENDKYKEIKFGDQIIFKGNINDYLKYIDFAKK